MEKRPLCGRNDTILIWSAGGARSPGRYSQSRQPRRRARLPPAACPRLSVHSTGHQRGARGLPSFGMPRGRCARGPRVGGIPSGTCLLWHRWWYWEFPEIKHTLLRLKEKVAAWRPRGSAARSRHTACAPRLQGWLVRARSSPSAPEQTLLQWPWHRPWASSSGLPAAAPHCIALQDPRSA